MAEASLKLGSSWATKESSLLGFNDENGNYKPIPFDFSRASIGTRVNRDGLIEVVQDNIPRIDFSNGEGSLKLEPQRTNYLINSDNGSSYTTFSATKTLNEVISLDGTLNSFTLEGNGDYNQILGESPFVTLPSAGDYTFSVFAKKGNHNFIQLFFNGFTGATNTEAYFDLENGTTPTSGASIDDYGNGWYRCSFVCTVVAGDLYGRIGFRISYTDSYFFFPTSNDANGKNGYFYGFQLEAGSYPTSYIPTSGSAVTRVKDACYKTGVSDLIGQPNGSIFLDFVYDNNFANTRIFSISENSWISGGSIRLEKSSDKFKWNWVDNGSAAGGVTSTTTMVVGTRYRIGITYTATSASLFLDGVKEDTASVTTPTQMNQIHINELGGGFIDANEFQRNIFNQVLLFPSALTDQEMIDLTTI